MIQQKFKITGCIQGVGFRPFVYQLATHLGLKGHVTNEYDGVHIEVLGSKAILDNFRQQLLQTHPVHARIDSLSVLENTADTTHGYSDFKILDSQQKTNESFLSTEVPADRSLCHKCLEELFDPQNRRYRYPFINCTDCGPRYSLINALPYDRQNTSMAPFHMCTQCELEYSSAANRRFHAQPNACQQCGPCLTLHDSSGQTVPGQDPVTDLADKISAGHIVAVKGVGGFHLVCDARNSEAVKKLRQRKQRPDKPFAVMALNTASLEPWVTLNKKSITQLNDSTAPIVLLPKQGESSGELPCIAEGMSDLGCLLPYTPVHYLIFHALLNKPARHDWLTKANDFLLVTTSANLSGEPLITDNDDCLEKLASIADYFLLHDRDILARCDDSLMQAGNIPAVIRRARGYAPRSTVLPELEKATSILACGAFLKNTFCLTQGNKAWLSPHIGELDSAESCIAFRSSIDHYLQLFDVKPDAIACDLHPDFYSSRFAEEFSRSSGIPLIPVQHHRAHIAAVIAEHRLEGPVLGLALDGTGLGDDHTPWGGELFYGLSDELERIGHLSPLPLPGGDIAAREIWRLAVALLDKTGKENVQQRYLRELEQHLKHNNQGQFNDSTLKTLMNQAIHTSSAGRWFDAVATLLTGRKRVSFEGQAAMELEQLALSCTIQPEPRQLASVCENGMLDLYPILPPLLNMKDASYAAASFHIELVDGLLRWLTWASPRCSTHTIVCSGGCFQNRILRTELKHRLEKAGFKVYFPVQIPANDGGISFGQAWIAVQQLAKGLY